MNHSKGFWRVVHEKTTLTNVQKNETFEVDSYRVSSDFSPICKVELSNLGNAHLIAAAPELLEALQDLVKQIKHSKTDHFSVSLAERAIEKSRGCNK